MLINMSPTSVSFNATHINGVSNAAAAAAIGAPGAVYSHNPQDLLPTGLHSIINDQDNDNDNHNGLFPLPTLKTSNNNMNSKVNKKLDRVPENLGPNGTTPSGKPRLFVCTTCTRAFARHEHLKRHERSHTKEKPFHCGVCQRRFSRRDLLLRHAQKLHAGCDDAIKRLRRRASRSKSINSFEDQDTVDTPSTDDGLKKRIKLEKIDPKHGDTFNFFVSNDIPPFNSSSSNNGPITLKGRRSSFSAASAANYASVPAKQPTYSDSVEFSTPQLLPVELSNNNIPNNRNLNSWISDINAIPGLDFLNNLTLNDPNNNGNNGNISTITTPNATKFKVINQSSFDDLRSNSLASPVSDSSAPPPRRRSSKSAKSSISSMRNDRKNNDIFGYSFYDDDYTFANQMADFQNMKFSYPKLPSSYLNDSYSSSPGEDSSNFNEYELLSELEIPNHEEKILSVGYSFYESNDFASSTISPSALACKDNLNNNAIKRSSSSLMDTDKNSEISSIDQLISSQKPLTNGSLLGSQLPQRLSTTSENSLFVLNGEALSSDFLFTPSMSYKIEKVLDEYPFVGLSAPHLPSIELLNQFVQNFESKFLSHYPFIHTNLLNEKAMFEYTKNTGDQSASGKKNDFTSLVCLPLLIGTIGALYSQEKRLAADLYEISRRCIHVYLDSRKKSEDAEKSTTHNSPLWLVQSLVLSVLYGLFADYDESDLSIILRQVNALCTLIKASKFNLVKFDHENIDLNDAYYRDYILYQSKIRTVFMIYNVSNILTCGYNLNPFIKHTEIKCDLPDLENYWDSRNVEEFKQRCVENSSLNYNLNLEKILNDMLMNNQIHYKVSEFGSSIIMFTVLQYFYFNKKTQLSNFSSGISPFHSNSSNLVKNFKWEDLLVDPSLGINLESILLKNIAVMRSLQIDISKIKDYMWTRRWQELSTEFIHLNPKNDDLLDACDYSIRTLSLIFINDSNSSNFRKIISLTSQFLFFNFFYIAKFLHKFERKISKNALGEISIKSQELKTIPKNFSIYLEIAKFLADLEQISIKNFNYHDVESKLALKDFDESRYNFGVAPRLLEVEYPREVDLNQVYKVTKLRLSSNILKIGEFIFNLIYQEEMNFNIFKSLSDGLFHLRLRLESE